ncbi:MAG: aminotransferase class V-fold PLP-dependent enzyme [Desulfopila sp.]|jgi:selenocysteine lyase/cysteine desulfurase|nr:aminotransferase class V-fold PLP-dependent enzyme [Desulfopila sp.]
MVDKSTLSFPAAEQNIFMAHCAISPLYAASAKAMQRFVEDMSNGGITALPGYLDTVNTFHNAVAAFLRTDARNISYVHNTAEALCMIANGYPFSPGDEIISYLHEYPSNHYPWVLQEKRGVKLVLLGDTAQPGCPQESDKPRGWSLEELERRISDKTRLVAVSHVQFSSGFGADLEKLGRLCRDRNVDLVVDCAQSLGCLPVYPEKYHLSAVVASGWKWLMGPKGSALLYTAEAFREKIASTMAGPGLMQQGLDYLDHAWAPHEDGRKFEYSTLPWDHLTAMSILLQEIFLSRSIEEIRAEVFRLQDIFLEHVSCENLRFFRFSPENRSGILAARYDGDVGKVVSALTKRGVIATAPVGYLRFAPHFYNTDKQMVSAAQKVNEVLREY